MALGGFGDITYDELKSDPEGYLKIINDSSPRTITVPDGETFTLSDHFILWAVDEEKKRFLAGISFRFDDNDLINTYAGHVGMSVRPSLLNKGYGVKAVIKMVELVEDEAIKRNMDFILASANSDNPASYKILEYKNGILINESDPYGWGRSRLYKLKK